MKNQKQKVRFQNLADQNAHFNLTAKEFNGYLIELLHELEEPSSYATREMLSDFREQLLENYYTYKFLCREFNWKVTAEIEQLEPFILLQEQKKSLNLQVRIKDRSEWLDNDLQLGKTNPKLQKSMDDIFDQFGEIFSKPTQTDNQN